mmetsp:Transcript_25783/g.29455  ORF Transcript_25783/g.29455 Transcript_25783/m.29455 type:complete len:121 (+) Transcript_25783:74-436(+)
MPPKRAPKIVKFYIPERNQRKNFVRLPFLDKPLRWYYRYIGSRNRVFIWVFSFSLSVPIIIYYQNIYFYAHESRAIERSQIPEYYENKDMYKDYIHKRKRLAAQTGEEFNMEPQSKGWFR